MKHPHLLALLLGCAAFFGTAELRAQIPQIINYQGKVLASGQLFSGAGQFRFALVDAAGTTTYWSNDGSSTAGSQPTAAVSLPVVNGLYVVPLGDIGVANMTAISPAVFAHADVRLRVWFDDGTHGSERLAPDQRIVSVGYAMVAATVPDGSITTDKLADAAVKTAKIADGAVGSDQLAAGAVKAANIATGAIGSTQLADGAVGTTQLGTGAVQMGNIANGAVGGTQIANNAIGSGHIINGAIGTTQIATGAITDSLMANATLTAEKLVKPVRSGSINSSSLSLDFSGGSFTVPFSPAFATVPNVTASIEAADGSPAATAQISLTTRTTGQFTAKVTGSALATAITTILDGAAGKGDAGNYVSMKVVNGNPALCFQDKVNEDLIYMRATDATGTAWGAPITIASFGAVGKSCSLEVINGNPAIAYFENSSNNFYFKYIRALDADGATWGTPVTLATIQNGYAAISLAVVNGFPAVAYASATGGSSVRFARATDASGTTWPSPVGIESGTLTNGREAIHLGIFGGNPIVAYTAGDGIRVVRANSVNGTSWGSAFSVDQNHPLCGSPCVQDVGGQPAVSYWVSNSGGTIDVRYARATGSFSWGSPKIIATASTVTGTSLAMLGGKPAVAFTNNSGAFLIPSSDTTGASWNSEVPIDASAAGADLACTFVAANLAVAYRQSDKGILGYSRATNTAATTWGGQQYIAGDGAVGRYPSMKMINGRPAISYYDETNGDLKFMIATDVAATAWNAPVTVDTGGSLVVGTYSSLAEVNGRPAVCYYESSIGRMRYVRANDSAGAAWGAPFTFVVNGDSGKYNSLAVVDGRPAISYFNDTDNEVTYIHALDADGAAWGSPLVLDAEADMNGATSLVVVNGRPAVCYASAGSLIYIRAADSIGGTWGAPISLEADGHSERDPFMAIVNGKPAIAFQDSTEDDLKYVAAADADGSAWLSGITLDAAGQTGFQPCLSLIGGNPTVSCVDPINKILKLVRAANATGSRWEVPSDFETGIVSHFTTSLLSIGGRTAIAYYDSQARDLKLLRPGAATPFTIQWIALEP